MDETALILTTTSEVDKTEIEPNSIEEVSKARAQLRRENKNSLNSTRTLMLGVTPELAEVEKERIASEERNEIMRAAAMVLAAKWQFGTPARQKTVRHIATIVVFGMVAAIAMWKGLPLVSAIGVGSGFIFSFFSELIDKYREKK